MPRLSIIVPVFNVEYYLPKCVDSILAQTYTDWELLLIDDGSQDSSGEKCDEYANTDERIKVFHKENGGVSSARNLGLDKISGDWLMFVDADDAIDPITIETCIPFLEKYDIVRFSMKRVMSEDGLEYNNYNMTEDDDKETYIRKLVKRQTVMSVWGAVYKSSIFIENEIRFDKDLISGEDWLVLLKATISANSIKIINRPLYLYSKYNECAATYGFKINNSISVMRAYYRIQDLLPNNYVKEFAYSKCEQEYSFYMQCLRNPGSITVEQFNSYLSTAGRMTIREIFISNIGMLRSLLLLVLSNTLGRFLLLRRLARSTK